MQGARAILEVWRHQAHTRQAVQAVLLQGIKQAEVEHLTSAVECICRLASAVCPCLPVPARLPVCKPGRPRRALNLAQARSHSTSPPARVALPTSPPPLTLSTATILVCSSCMASQVQPSGVAASSSQPGEAQEETRVVALPIREASWDRPLGLGQPVGSRATAGQQSREVTRWGCR